MNGTGVAKYEAEAVKLYKLAADQGHAKAQCSLGDCHSEIFVPTILYL